MDPFTKLCIASRACDLETCDDSEIPSLARHPENPVSTAPLTVPQEGIPPSKLQDFEIFHAQMGGSRTIPLLKTMLTTYCENNCNYCGFRKDRDFQRVGFSPDEMAGLFMRVLRRGLVRGLFLSSGIAGSLYRSQDRLLDCVSIVRKKYGFRGYIHLKLLPGVQDAHIREAVRLADRVSINLEGPNEHILARLAPQKRFESDLVGRLGAVHNISIEDQAERPPGSRPASVTTQLVMGAVGESDTEILQSTQYLYQHLQLNRVYYSAFSPTTGTPFENLPPLPHLRHARMYQASFLLRDYAFNFEELPFTADGNLRTEGDPKLLWANENLAASPVDIGSSDVENLMRVPGFGRIIARRIVEMRRSQKINSLADLKKMGIPVKRCQPFILINGKRPVFQPELWG